MFFFFNFLITYDVIANKIKRNTINVFSIKLSFFLLKRIQIFRSRRMIYTFFLYRASSYTLRAFTARDIYGTRRSFGKNKQQIFPILIRNCSR